MNTATIHYLHGGQFVSAGSYETRHTDPQACADAVARLAEGPFGSGAPVDEVHVWLGPVDGRAPDATAQVQS